MTMGVLVNYRLCYHMNAPVTQLCCRIFRKLCCYNIPFGVLALCLGSWTALLLAAATSLWIILFIILRMLSGWCACRMAVTYGSACIREASGNHQERQDLQSKCIALTWPFSCPKPCGGSWENSCTRAYNSHGLLAHQSYFFLLMGGMVRKTGLYFYWLGKLPGQWKVSSLIFPFIILMLLNSI